MIAGNPSFVIAAYAITWIVLLAYLLRLARRDSAVRARHASVSREPGELPQ